MNQPALESPEDSAQTLHALAGQYVNRKSSTENYLLFLAIEFWLSRLVGLEPLSRQGRLVGGLIWGLMVLLPALILTAVTGQWADAPLLPWIIVAVAYGAAAVPTPSLHRSAACNAYSWVWAIIDETDLRKLIAWERRWYSHRVAVPVSGALTLGMILLWYFFAFFGPGLSVPAGTLYVAVFLVFVIMQVAYGIVMVAFEAHNLSTCRYELYRLSPADSVAVRQSLRGYNQFGAIAVAMSTFIILVAIILLPSGSRAVAPVVLSLLLVEYVCTAVGTLIPRLLMGRIIRIKKEEEMEILQVRLNDLLPQLEELTEEEYERMQRLQETQDAIRDSPENLLPLGELAKVVGALLLSTLTVLVTAFAQEWIAGLLKLPVP